MAPLSPLLVAIRRPNSRFILFVLTAVVAGITLFVYGPETVTLLGNRRDRESGPTFYFGFWQLVPFADNAYVRTGSALLLSVSALVIYQRGWISFPAALTFMAIVTIAASPSFGHTRYVMLLPLVVYLIRSRRGQVVYLGGLLVWACIPLADFFRYGSMFADSVMTPLHRALLILYTNVPIALVVVLLLLTIPWRSLGVKGRTASIFEPVAAARLTPSNVPVVEAPQRP